ncbi:2Fe-2S iron-sulfur cluster-binding protein [Aurantiacibacter luteus]
MRCGAAGLGSKHSCRKGACGTCKELLTDKRSLQ